MGIGTPSTKRVTMNMNREAMRNVSAPVWKFTKNFWNRIISKVSTFLNPSESQWMSYLNSLFQFWNNFIEKSPRVANRCSMFGFKESIF